MYGERRDEGYVRGRKKRRGMCKGVKKEMTETQGNERKDYIAVRERKKKRGDIKKRKRRGRRKGEKET